MLFDAIRGTRSLSLSLSLSRLTRQPENDQKLPKLAEREDDHANGKSKQAFETKR